MNKRKLEVLLNMQRRLDKYASDEQDEEIAYELQLIAGQFENLWAYLEEYE